MKTLSDILATLNDDESITFENGPGDSIQYTIRKPTTAAIKTLSVIFCISRRELLQCRVDLLLAERLRESLRALRREYSVMRNKQFCDKFDAMEKESDD